MMGIELITKQFETSTKYCEQSCQWEKSQAPGCQTLACRKGKQVRSIFSLSDRFIILKNLFDKPKLGKKDYIKYRKNIFFWNLYFFYRNFRVCPVTKKTQKKFETHPKKLSTKFLNKFVIKSVNFSGT